MNIQQQSFHKIGALLLAVLTLLGFGLGQGAPVQAAPLAATVTVELWAKTGTLTLPGPVNVPIWGYSDTVGGAAQIPGPAIIVNAGDTVNVTLHNDLGEASSLFFGGQALPPDLTGAPATGGTASYSFVATSPGTYLYEAGPLPNAQHQTAMGLFGALIVRPTSAPDVVIPGQAYADPATAYDDEAVVVLSEIDPNLNNSATPADFDMRTYSPRYWLINGKAHPDTTAIASDAGRKVLLRYVNAGLQYHSMTVLGLNQTVIAKDGSPLLYPYSLGADTIAPGQTADMITLIPGTAAAGSRFALHDSNLLTLRNTNATGFGGMVTFITTVGSGPGPDTTGPTTSGVAVTAGTLNATVDDTATGGSNVVAAEYYVDSTTGTATAMSGAFGGPSAAVNAVIAPATLAGNHVFYVRGQDSAGNWGPFSSVNFTAADTTGPATVALALAPNPSNGTADVTLTGTANDSATGNNNIAAAEFFIGAPGANGTGTALTVNTVGPLAGLSYTIPAATVNALAQNTYQVYVHSRDAANNWGTFAQVALKVDKTGPTTSAVSAAPSASNGTTGLSPSQPFVRVQATLSDSDFVVAAASETSADSTAAESTTAPTEAPVDAALVNRVYMAIVQTSVTNVEAAAVVPNTSYVKTAEGFIDVNPTPAQNGTGFPLTPSDGLFDEGVEDAYVFIPLTTINQLSNGNHTIYIHGQDGAGNWGPTSSIVFVVDKTPPTFSGITLTPNTFVIGSIANVVMTVNGANGTGTAVVGGEYWFGTTDPAPGGGTAFTGLTPNIPVGSLAVGTYTVRARIRDAAGNWSTGTGGVRSATLTVTPPPPPPLYFSTSGTSNPPGVGGSADDADIYFWNGSTAFSRVIDASAAPYSLPGGANVDGFDRVDATHFYLSFNGNVTIPRPGPDLSVQDEDIVYYNAGVWSLYFDGSARNLESGNFDLDAISIVGVGGPGNVYFSLDSNNSPPGVAGGGDDADIYRWNGGNSYTRLFDASALGWSTTNVDGFVYIDATHFYLSYSGDTTVPVVGAVQDEDVVYYNNGVWSVYFDGTGVGLTAGNLDIDAFDLP